MVHEDRDEPLDRSEQRAVQHHAVALLSRAIDVADVEALRHHEVELDGSALPRSATAVAQDELELRAVDRAVAGLHDIRQAELLDDLPELALRAIPPCIVSEAILRA